MPTQVARASQGEVRQSLQGGLAVLAWSADFAAAARISPAQAPPLIEAARAAAGHVYLTTLRLRI